MKYLVYISLIFLSPPLFSNEVEIIKLHENKSLDQLVLDQIENENSQNLQITNTDNDEIKLDEEIDSQNLIESENINNEIDIKENIWNNIDPQYVKNVLNNTQNIRSKVLQNEFNNFLFNLDLNYELDNNKEIFYNVVEYFYKKRDISKAYLFLQSREKPNDNNLEY